MFLFNRNPNKSVMKKNTAILDYMYKMEKLLFDYSALHLKMSMLQEGSVKAHQRQSLLEMFETVIKNKKGDIFTLPNEDIVVFFQRSARDAMLVCLIKLRFLLHDDPFICENYDLEKAGFAQFYDFANGSFRFKDMITTILEHTKNDVVEDENIKNSLYHPNKYKVDVKTKRRELTPPMLAKLQKTLVITDFSSLIRRQAVCAVIGNSVPQMLFEEVYVSIPDLRDTLLPDVDLTANPWLFQYLTETLDKRVLVSVSRHDDGSLINNFSLNLNVSTVLSDDFLQFDEGINASMRSSIVLELQLTDVLGDIKAYTLAKTFAQYRGYKICIDGITVDKLKYINREQLGADFVKIIWHPTFMDVMREDTHFMDYENKAERAKMIICRVDDPQAVEVGNSLGINLYQGRYIQHMLSEHPKKTFFAKR